MKKIIAVALLILMCCAPLCACSLDFSAEIDEAMDGLYDTLYNALELFFKQTGVDDSDSNEGVTDGDNQGGENSGSGESGDNQGSQGTVDDDKNPTAPSGSDNNQTAPDGGNNTANDDNQSINTDDSITDNGSGLENSQDSEDTKNEK